MHIHWYKTEFNGYTTMVLDHSTIAVRKKIRKCRCGVIRLKMRGGW